MKRYILFNKPYGVLSQFTGAPGQKTLADFSLPNDIYAAGRLDKDSEGLLLLTNDGPLIEKLLNPDNAHPRTYLVQVDGVPGQQDLDKLMSGLEMKGYRAKPCEAKLLTEEPKLWDRLPPIRERKNLPTSWLQVTLIEGKNRQVRKMTAQVGFPTLRLVRSQIGCYFLDGLGLGEWMELKDFQFN